MRRLALYAVVIAPDPEHIKDGQTSYVGNTFTQARNAWKAAKTLADLVNGNATITVVKVA